MKENICHFVPFSKDVPSLHTINFVLETKTQRYTGLKSQSVYKMHFVCSGQGKLHTQGKISPLKKGDVFFSFPSSPFAIESGDDLTYMYISFVGFRGNMIMEKFKINVHNFLFHDCDELETVWKTGILAGEDVMELISESVLLYSFSCLGNRLSPQNQPRQQHSVDKIKKYLDENFTDPHFSLEKMSRDLSYNQKYISSLFKSTFGIGIVAYLNTIRIQNACTMMEQGSTSINDIADRCGYSDPQYFSKVFKSKIGVTPSRYVKEIKAR